MSNLYSVKFRDAVDQVLKQSLNDFQKENKLSDNTLLSLYNVFGEIFERGLELYEQRRVVRISVSDPNSAASIKNKHESRWLMQVKGLSGLLYTIFPDVNYCTCTFFRSQVLDEQNAFTCKHVLAVWLASVDKEKLMQEYITSKQMQTLLLFQTATCLITENGLKVTVEDAKCMQASAYIPVNVFETFTLKEDIIFRLNLTVLVECLSMFWININAQDSVALQFFYKGVGHPVTVLIEEGGVITDCSLKTQNADELLDFHLDQESVLTKIVLQTELLKDILTELDTTSDLIEFLLSPEPPYFRISTHGLAGICHVEIPHDSNLVDSFECTVTATSRYKLSHVKPAMKALSYANKVALRTNDTGLLCFQCTVKTESGETCYIEYYISSVLNMDDDDDD